MSAKRSAPSLTCSSTGYQGSPSCIQIALKKNHGVDEAGFLHARLLNEIRWIVLDLALGMVDKTHPLLWYLTMNRRMTNEDFAWFQAHRIKEPKRLIVGVDYYPHSEVAWGEHRRIQRHPHAIGLDGVTREYVDRYAPLGCRFAITETNVRGRIADRISWLKYVMETVEKLTSTGIALEGVTWFPFIDSTCWGNLLCNTRGSIDPQGIYWLREDTLERMPSELSELHALLAQGKITSQEIPAYQFEPGPVLNGRVVGNFLKFMQGWRWIDPSPEEIKL